MGVILSTAMVSYVEDANATNCSKGQTYKVKVKINVITGYDADSGTYIEKEVKTMRDAMYACEVGGLSEQFDTCKDAKKKAKAMVDANEGLYTRSYKLGDTIDKGSQAAQEFALANIFVETQCRLQYKKCISACDSLSTLLINESENVVRLKKYCITSKSKNDESKPYTEFKKRVSTAAKTCKNFMKDVEIASEGGMKSIHYYLNMKKFESEVDGGLTGSTVPEEKGWWGNLSPGGKVAVVGAGAIAAKWGYDKFIKDDKLSKSSWCKKKRGSPEAVRDADCQGMYVSSCSADPAGPNCKVFANAYCGINAYQATVGSGTDFCDAMEKKYYCDSPEAAGSPSCGETVVAGACSSPSSQACIDLAAQCNTYPDDPQCKAIEGLLANGTIGAATESVTSITPPESTNSAEIVSLGASRTPSAETLTLNSMGITCEHCGSNLAKQSKAYGSLCSSGKLSGCVATNP